MLGDIFEFDVVAFAVRGGAEEHLRGESSLAAVIGFSFFLRSHFSVLLRLQFRVVAAVFALELDLVCPTFQNEIF